VCAALAACSAGGRARPAPAPDASTTRPARLADPVAVALPRGLSDPGAAVSSDFLGLSFEVAELPRLAAFATRGDLVALLRTAGVHRLRLGGTTADTEAAWSPAAGVRPRWATVTVTPADLDGLGRLARLSAARVLLTVNLGHLDAAAAASEARAARASLGGALEALEIGNEPDHFVHHGLRAPGYDVDRYLAEVDEYRPAIARSAPGLGLAGPDVVSPSSSLRWVRAEAAHEHPALLTAHFYPLGHCGSYVPTISALLSSGVRRAEAATLTLGVELERETGIPFALDETNDVACGGEPGVSNTFASALWALDYISRAMASGIAGLYLHGNLAMPDGYAPIAASDGPALAAGRLRAEPGRLPGQRAGLPASRRRPRRARRGRGARGERSRARRPAAAARLRRRDGAASRGPRRRGAARDHARRGARLGGRHVERGRASGRRAGPRPPGAPRGRPGKRRARHARGQPASALSVATPAAITNTPTSWIGRRRSPNASRPRPTATAPVSDASTAATARP